MSLFFNGQPVGAGSNGIKALGPDNMLQFSIETARCIRLPQGIPAVEIQAGMKAEESPDHDIRKIRATDGFTADCSGVGDAHRCIVIPFFRAVKLRALRKRTLVPVSYTHLT